MSKSCPIYLPVKATVKIMATANTASNRLLGQPLAAARRLPGHREAAFLILRRSVLRGRWGRAQPPAGGVCENKPRLPSTHPPQANPPPTKDSTPAQS